MKLAADRDSYISQLRAGLFSRRAPGRRIECIETLVGGIEAEHASIIEELLVEVLETDENAIVRHEAAFCLGKLVEKSYLTGDLCVQALANGATSDSSLVVRHECAESLGVFNHHLARATLEILRSDPDPDIAETAKVSLECGFRRFRTPIPIQAERRSG